MCRRLRYAEALGHREREVQGQARPPTGHHEDCSSWLPCAHERARVFSVESRRNQGHSWEWIHSQLNNVCIVSYQLNWPFCILMVLTEICWIKHQGISYKRDEYKLVWLLKHTKLGLKNMRIIRITSQGTENQYHDLSVGAVKYRCGIISVNFRYAKQSVDWNRDRQPKIDYTRRL